MADDGGPVFGDGLGADFIELGDGEAGKTLAVPGIVMGLPADGDAVRSRRNFKEDDSALWGVDLVNLAKGGGGLGIVSNLLL